MIGQLSSFTDMEADLTAKYVNFKMSIKLSTSVKKKKKKKVYLTQKLKVHGLN